MVISFKEFLVADEVDQFVVETAGYDSSYIKEALLNEGRWVPSAESGWMIRVDAEDPAINGKRHVHIAQAKHVSAKNMQASWNDDGTRHDRKSFNEKVASRSVVQSLARKALGLADDVVLESMEPDGVLLLEVASRSSGDGYPEKTVFLRVA